MRGTAPAVRNCAERIPVESLCALVSPRLVDVRIALVRHGQTDWNLEGRLQGASDIPLNDTGRQQAADAADLLRAEGQRWEGITSSPLSRARDTAHIIGESLGIPVFEPIEPLKERDYGPAEGMIDAEAYRRFHVDGEWVGDGIEPFDELQERALRALDLAATEHPIDGLLVVAHGTLIRSIVDALTGERTKSIPNAASVHLEGEPGRWQVIAGIVPAHN